METSMNSLYEALSPSTLAALNLHLQKYPLAGSLRDIVDCAVTDWLARQSSLGEAVPGAGYRWKNLFLPAGTELRLEYNSSTHHARVIGDDLVFEGQRVSPRRMLMQLTGLTGNAWYWITVRLPGERQFVRARALRARLNQTPAPAQPNVTGVERRLADALERLERVTAERRRTLPPRQDTDNEYDPALGCSPFDS